MKRFLALIMLGLFAAPAAAQPPGTDFGWYARGTFGNPALDYDGLEPLDRWNDLSHELDFIGGNHWTVTVPDLLPNTRYQFKIGDRDYNPSMPNQDGFVFSDTDNDPEFATGKITFHMYDQETWTDGWLPNNKRRVGYDDSGVVDWELMGSWNSFAAGTLLDDMGNGLHQKVVHLNAGIQEFKFRQQGDWNWTIGNRFGTGPTAVVDFSKGGGGNVQFTVPPGGADVLFELDLPLGRFRAAVQAPPQAGDHNNDGFVDALDYVHWRASDEGNAAGYTEWAENYGEGTPPGWIIHSVGAGDKPLIHQGGSLYTAEYLELTPGADYEFQAVRTDLSVQVPGSAVKIRADDNGDIKLNFNELIPLGWEDGYGPNNEHRLGYEDSQEYDWEIVGTFNTHPTEGDWPTENDPAWALIDQGNGIHSETFTFATPGEHSFKFRHITADQGTDAAWSTSIGNNFGNGAGNIGFTVTDPGEEWLFELDLSNGRWKVSEVIEEGSGNAVPEPASVALALLGALALMGITGRKQRVR